MKPAINLLLQKVRDYFTDPEHRKDFEKWYQERYGKEYVWRSATRK